MQACLSVAGRDDRQPGRPASHAVSQTVRTALDTSCWVRRAKRVGRVEPRKRNASGGDLGLRGGGTVQVALKIAGPLVGAINPGDERSLTVTHG